VVRQSAQRRAYSCVSPIIRCSFALSSAYGATNGRGAHLRSMCIRCLAQNKTDQKSNTCRHLSSGRVSDRVFIPGCDGFAYNSRAVYLCERNPEHPGYADNNPMRGVFGCPVCPWPRGVRGQSNRYINRIRSPGQLIRRWASAAFRVFLMRNAWRCFLSMALICVISWLLPTNRVWGC
jgi:hypothetical protein